MKHAYLILAHNQFDLLQILVSAIDDIRNDIYIHIDKKVGNLPDLKVDYSRLFFTDNRIDVRWGELSVVKAEYALMEQAFYSGNNYRYFHLLSGVDLPLRNQNVIHEFFESLDGKEFLGYNNSVNLPSEIDRKIRRIHLFSSDFRGSGFLFQIKRAVRYLFIKLQEVIGYKRYRKQSFKKGTQWFSITNLLLSYAIEKKEEVMKTYKNTFCADEIFMHTLAWNSRFIERMYNLEDEACGCMREVGWNNGVLETFNINDLGRLLESNKLFARKFSSNNINVVYGIITNLKST